MGDKTNSLAVKDFRSEVDHFDSWVKLFEQSVTLAYPDATADELEAKCKTWFPFKLDDAAKTVHERLTKTGWAAIKTEFAGLLVDPSEKYNWRVNRTSIKWDGIESFDSLATRIMRSVDKFDPHCQKQQEYYLRFRWALPGDYKKAIDFKCGDDKLTIEEAKKVAYKVQLAKLDDENTAAPEARNVSFMGASMSGDGWKMLKRHYIH